jgi:transcriptional regulator with XRE-family HTH domain
VRVRIVIGKASVTAFASRLGISRQWLHDILSGRVSPEASVATLSNISDTMGYSLEWLMTGKGMPEDRWNEKTTLVPRLEPKISAGKKISLEMCESELVLLLTSALHGFEAHVSDLGVLRGEIVDMGPLVGPSDEVLVDLRDHQLVNNGLFVAQVEQRLLACRAIKARSAWVLSSSENITSESLITDFRILGRIRLIWKLV